MSLEATHTIPVFRSADLFVSHGVAEGDGISFLDDLVMDDVYQLRAAAMRGPLSYAEDPENDRFVVAEGSASGAAGNALYLDSCLTFMAPDGTTLEAIVLVEVEEDAAAEVYLQPLAQLEPDTDYRLVGGSRETARAKFAEVAFVSFARGTHITMASGAQVPIEDLKPGDRVLTRDEGPQEIRWIGETTLRAVGDFAPVVISEGALFNTRDLVLSPDHRLFIYQRTDEIGAGRAEVLIKARHLVNGDTVVQRDGGFIDYFQILFDAHQIIYAEGIAAETLLVDSRTRAALPQDLSETLANAASHGDRPHAGFELEDGKAKKADMVSLLKKASSS